MTISLASPGILKAQRCFAEAIYLSHDRENEKLNFTRFHKKRISCGLIVKNVIDNLWPN
jgi:hypothetical protein